MNIVDYIALGIILLTAIRITMKGFIVEFSSKSALFVGLAVALMFSSTATSAAPAALTDQLGRWIDIAAFFVFFFVGYVVTKVFLHVLIDVADVINLDLLDTMLGFVLGILEGAIIVSLIVYLLQFQQVVDFTQAFNESQVITILRPLVPSIGDVVKTEVIEKLQGVQGGML